MEKYTSRSKSRGIKMLIGNSEIIFAKKYEETSYMLLLTSLRKTGLSSGKIKIMF
jgi:hypothetical protein